MRYLTGLAILLISTAVFSQQAPTQQQVPNEVQNYAPYNIALLPTAPGGEIVLPFMTTDNKLAFFPLSEVQQASKEKRLLGRLISYGELIALIGELQIEVNHLKQENEKLWAVVGKSSTPVVQPTETPRRKDDDLMKYLLLRQLLRPQQPYQIPMPTPPTPLTPPNKGVNCTTTYIGSTAYTNCN
jgi:hypothetical protein